MTVRCVQPPPHEVAGDVQGGRARVHHDALAVLDELGAGGADARLLVGLEPLADVERQLGPAPVDRDRAAVRPDEAVLALECEEVLADRDRRDAEPQGELGDAGTAVLLDDPSDVFLAFAGEDVAWRGVVGAHGQGRTPSICGERKGFDSEHYWWAYRNVKNHIEIIRKVWHATHGARRNGRRNGQRLCRQRRATDRLTAHHRGPPPPGRDGRVVSRVGAAGPPTGVTETDRSTDRPRATEATVTQHPAIISRHRVPADRAAVVGVRQLRARGSRSSPSRASRATRTRRSTTRRRSTATPASRRRSRCTSRGTRSTTTPSSAATPRTAASRLGTINSNDVPGRRLHARQRLPPRPAGPPQGHRPPARVRRHHGRDRLPRPQAVVRRRHQLPGPGRHPRLGRTGWPRPSPTVYARLGDDQRMVLEYKLFEPAFYTMDVPDWGTASSTACALGDQGQGRRRHRPPRARHEHRVHRRVAAARGQARRVRLQLAVLRRRRPDGRRGRPVPAVPDHARGRPRRTRSARGRASRSCSTSATTSSRRSPARSGR